MNPAKPIFGGIPWFFVNQGKEIGALAELLHESARAMNFTYKLVPTPDGKIGNKEKDGNFSGLIGLLQRKVWIAIGLSILTLTTMSVIVDKVLYRVPGNFMNQGEDKPIGWWTYLLNYIAAFFNEATPRDPKRNTNRFLLILWCISVITLINSFTGHFKSRLTIRPEAKQIENLYDLAQKSGIRIMTWKGTILETLVKTSESKSVRKIYETILKTNGLLTSREIYTRPTWDQVIAGKTVLLTERTSLNYYMGLMCQANYGRVHVSSEAIMLIPSQFALRKGLSEEFRNDFNERLYRYYESGIFTKWIENMYLDYGRCFHNNDDGLEEKTLDFKDMRAIFILWLIPLFLSAIVFIFEVLSFKRRSQKRKRILGF